MYIRILKEEELYEAVLLANQVFDEMVAPGYTQQGIEEFKKSMNLESLLPLWENHELIFWGCYAKDGEREVLLGMAAANTRGHIVMFYVKPEHQHHGVGKYLYQAVYDYCTRNLVLTRMTVNSTPGAVTVYQHLGFRVKGEEQEVRGIRFQAMELVISPGNMQAKEQSNKKKTLAIVLIVIGILAFILLTACAWKICTNYIQKALQSESGTLSGNDGSDRYGSGDYGDNGDTDSNNDDYDGSMENGLNDSETNNQGIASLETYTEGTPKYKVEEKKYTYTSDAKSEYYWDFQVKYPQLSGLDDQKADIVNQLLKDRAMATVDRIYNHPNEDVKEKMLQAKSPCGVSYVNYKTTYMSDAFISVAYEERCAIGESTNQYYYLRSLNINLSTGEVYEPGDIVTMDETFMRAWRTNMEKEAPNSEFLSALSDEDAKAILMGDTKGEEYSPAFFVTETGLEMGMSYRYSSNNSFGTSPSTGWITAPFTWDELSAYKSTSSFWKLVQ